MIGSASGGHGRMHACTVSGGLAAADTIELNAAAAASTRAGSACVIEVKLAPVRASPVKASEPAARTAGTATPTECGHSNEVRRAEGQ